MSLTDWLVPLASVLVAVITFLGVALTARSRKDPSTSEVWTENSNLRDRLDKQDGKIEGLESRLDKAEGAVRVIGRGFDVLYRLFGHNAIDTLNPLDRDSVDQARRLRESSTV